MNILGVSALYHDSSAALCINGNIVAAVQEERFTRKKFDSSIPINSINYCLDFAGISPSQLDAVIYYDNPILTMDRWLKNCIALGEKSEKIIEKSFMSIYSKKLWLHKQIEQAVGGLGKHGKLLVCEHHISHAASAFYPSPFMNSAIITLDGVGEWATTTIGVGHDTNINILNQINYPHSLGLLYSAFTYFCGFKVNSGEYKLMGLAPYGEPKYYDKILENLIEVKSDGSYKLNIDYFAYVNDNVMTDNRFEELFGCKRREAESVITKIQMDLAASVQKVTEDIIIKMATYAKKLTGEKNLTLAGGVALNCVANGKLLRENIFENIWIQPAASDAGGSIGAALYAYYRFFGQDRQVSLNNRDTQKGSYLGPSFTNEEIKSYLDTNKCKYYHFVNKQELYEKVAQLLSENKVIGLFNGRMEFGPRALGARSIIANPMSRDMQSKLNLKIKFRESFRPFAPSVLSDKINKYFDLDVESPYMLLVAQVKDNIKTEFNLKNIINENNYDMLKVVNDIRSEIPSVTHVDYSARIQSVNGSDNQAYYAIIKAFEKITGCSVIVNTSFNVRGEPIVCTPQDAYRCFMRTDMDVLVLENCILYKEDQPLFSDNIDWRKEYELD